MTQRHMIIFFLLVWPFHFFFFFSRFAVRKLYGVYLTRLSLDSNSAALTDLANDSKAYDNLLHISDSLLIG